MKMKIKHLKMIKIIKNVTKKNDDENIKKKVMKKQFLT